MLLTSLLTLFKLLLKMHFLLLSSACLQFCFHRFMFSAFIPSGNSPKHFFTLPSGLALIYPTAVSISLLSGCDYTVNRYYCGAPTLSYIKAVKHTEEHGKFFYFIYLIIFFLTSDTTEKNSLDVRILTMPQLSISRRWNSFYIYTYLSYCVHFKPTSCSLYCFLFHTPDTWCQV